MYVFRWLGISVNWIRINDSGEPDISERILNPRACMCHYLALLILSARDISHVTLFIDVLQTKSASCAFSRMRKVQGKHQNPARVTWPAAVNIPSRLPAVEDKLVATNRAHWCPMNSATSIWRSPKSEVEGGGNGLTWWFEGWKKPLMSPA